MSFAHVLQCHQGVFNVTDRFANSLWLVDRLGIMSKRGAQMMARQSLIGFNYSLLGNFPAEAIRPTPDYFTTLLFRDLAGSKVLKTQSSGPSTLRTYGFCSARKEEGGVVLVAINLSPDTAVSITAPASLGAPQDYVLTPDWNGDPAAAPELKTTAAAVQLNGVVLSIGPTGDVPAFKGMSGRTGSLVLAPLTMAFVDFPEAESVSACQ